MTLVGLVMLFGPAVLLLFLGVTSADKRDVRSPAGLLALFVVCTGAWLAYSALVPHTEGGETAWGTAPRYGDDDSAVLYVFGAIIAAAALAGWRRVAPPAAIAATAVVGPLCLAWWTTPRGDEDGLWTLIFPMLGLFGAFIALVATITAGVGRRTDETASGRLAAMRAGALVVDAACFGLLAWAPADVLGDAGVGEIAGLVLGVAAAIGYLAIPIAFGGATLGHRLLALRVVDADGGAVPSPLQAIARSGIVVAECVVAVFVVGLTLIPELISVGSGNASFADALCRTRVVSASETRFANSSSR